MSKKEEKTYEGGQLPELQVTTTKQSLPFIHYDTFGNVYSVNRFGQRIQHDARTFDPTGMINLPAENFENARLHQAQITDVNHTHQFADQVQNFALGLVTGTGAEDVIFNPLFNPLFNKGLKFMKKSNKNYTEDVIKLLGSKKTKHGFLGNRSNTTRAISDYLQKQGVNVSKLSNEDLINLQLMRRESVLNSIPKNKRVAIVTEFKSPGTSTIEYILKEGDDVIRSSDNYVTNGTQHVGNLSSQNYSKHNISRDLYDSALKYGSQNNYKGLISGDNLQSPEQTIHIWQKWYPKRKVINKRGMHFYNHGKNVNKIGKEYKISGDVVDLKTPATDIPTKSQNIFHPDMIDKNTWTLKSPHWNDKNVFKTVIPGIAIYGITSAND